MVATYELLNALDAFRSKHRAGEACEEPLHVLDAAYDRIKYCELEDEIISGINAVLTSYFETDDVYRRVCDELYKLIEWDRVSIALFEEAKGIVTAFVLAKGHRPRYFLKNGIILIKGVSWN